MKQKIKPRSEIHHLLFMAAKQAHGGVEQWFLKHKIGATPLQFGILRAVGKEGRTLNDLARYMMFKPPSILPSVDALEAKGYLIRHNDPDDRRKIYLKITPKGKRVVERVMTSRSLDPLGAAFKKLSASRKKMLISLLTELNHAIQKNT